MPQSVISLKNSIIRDENRRFRAPVDFELAPGEHIALIGANGSGKTTLVETLLGKLYLDAGTLRYDFGTGDDSAYRNIRHITFRDAYGAVTDGNYYYQQRWNAADREEVPLVRDLLAGVGGDSGLRDGLYALFGMEPLLDRQVILLSSGELRRYQIVRMLLSAPRVLILENPFIGLDAQTRALLRGVLEQAARVTGLQLILAVSAPEDIPGFITHVYVLDRMRVGPKQTLSAFRASEDFTARRDALERTLHERPPVLPPVTTVPLDAPEMVALRGVTIRYGKRTILDGIDWTILNGEKWMLSGANGSGKSTLLSLICADNPQAYAQDIALYGRPRGTGESIWDIKRHIGYVSPEMHRSYVKDIPAVDIVASGFFDSIGLYRRADDGQREVCRRWMESFGIAPLAGRSFLRLSSGEQRLALLARAFVKDPDLLILDEPLHGLDCFNKVRARAVIEAFCRRPGKTLCYVTHYEEELPSCVDRYMRL